MRKPLFFTFKKKKAPPLIVHFCYHKAMTVYFNRVFMSLAKEADWYFKSYKWFEFDEFTEDIQNLKKESLLMVGPSLNVIDLLPRRYLGSHIVRDPRDLLVSGYKYHKWAQEPWIHERLNEAMINRLVLKGFKLDFDYSNMSYQQLINSVDQTVGLEIELNWRTNSLNHMFDWDYQNPMVMELRYENVFGNEVETFTELFKHYSFDNKMMEIGIKFVRHFSFENQKETGKTGDNQHLTMGVSGQWKEYFSDELKAIFKERHQDLLVKLGYEQDDSWCTI